MKGMFYGCSTKMKTEIRTQIENIKEEAFKEI